MSGFDHDFAVSESADQLLYRWLRRIRRIWPDFVIGAGDEVLATSRALPRTFGNGFVVSRDLEMQRHSDEHGFVPDQSGQSSVSVWIIPAQSAGCHVDLVLPERQPSKFASIVLAELFASIVLGYRVAFVRDPTVGTRSLSLDHPMAPEWCAETLAACRQLRTNSEVKHGFEIWSQPSPHLLGGTRLGIEFARGAERRDVQLGMRILCETVGCWHTISYLDMKQHMAYACPPGKAVVRDGRIEFDGPGCAYPF